MPMQSDDTLPLELRISAGKLHRAVTVWQAVQGDRDVLAMVFSRHDQQVQFKAALRKVEESFERDAPHFDPAAPVRPPYVAHTFTVRDAKRLARALRHVLAHEEASRFVLPRWGCRALACDALDALEVLLAQERRARLFAVMTEDDKQREAARKAHLRKTTREARRMKRRVR